MKRVGNFSPAYQGRTFFFVGRAAKPIAELPTLDSRSYTVEPGSRPTPTDEDFTSSPEQHKAVEKALEDLGGLERFDAYK
jgi:hypothetical protein